MANSWFFSDKAIFASVLLVFVPVYLLYHISAYRLKHSLKDKIILVTGCDTGFGHALAKQLDHMQCIVFATCISAESAKQLDEQTSTNVHILMMDVSNIDDILAAYKTVKQYCLKHQSSLYGLVNNAGIGNASPFECDPRRSFNKVIQVNCVGLIDVTRTFLPLMRLRKYNPKMSDEYRTKCAGLFGRGRGGRIIVNMASVASRVAGPYMTAYAVSKFGVAAFTESIRAEMSEFFNIWCTTVEPFFVMTNLVKQSMDLQRVAPTWQSIKRTDEEDDDDDDVDGIMDVYDLARYLQWKQQNNELLRQISIQDCDHVIDAMVSALSSVFPLQTYYPSWRAAIFVWMHKYVLPGWVVAWHTKCSTFSIKPLKQEKPMRSFSVQVLSETVSLAQLQKLMDLINDVYDVAEHGMWKQKGFRTTVDELRSLNQHRRLIVAAQGPRIVGSIKVAIESGAIGEFGMLAVHPSFRQHGIGGKLIKAAEDWAVSQQCTEMQLEILTPRTWKQTSKESIKLWFSRLGYRPVRTELFEEHHQDLVGLLATDCDFTVWRKPLID